MRHGDAADTEVLTQNRIPGESRDPPCNVSGAAKWVPAFAGNADISCLRDLRVSVVKPNAPSGSELGPALPPR